MKKLLILFLCLCTTTEAVGGIRALGAEGSAQKSHSSSNTNNNNISSTPIINLKGSNTSQRCMETGFTMQKCPAGYVAVFPCPENNRYFRDCCPQDYRFSRSRCLELGLEPSMETCLGFHACRPKKQEETTTKPNKLIPNRQPSYMQKTEKQHNNKNK